MGFFDKLSSFLKDDNDDEIVNNLEEEENDDDDIILSVFTKKSQNSVNNGNSGIKKATANIKAGDIVQHKLGGPLMVVSFIEDEVALCNWLNNGSMDEDNFTLSTIEKMPEEQQIKSIREINVGDFVQFKLGGPTMVVELIEDGAASCQWRTSGNDFKSDLFTLASLKIVEA